MLFEIVFQFCQTRYHAPRSCDLMLFEIVFQLLQDNPSVIRVVI